MDLCLHCGYKFSTMENKIASTCPICGKETRRHEKNREANGSDIGTGKITRKQGEGTDAHVAALAREAVMMSPFASFISPTLIKRLFGISIFSSICLYAGLLAFLYVEYGLYYAIAGAVLSLVPILYFILVTRLLLETAITLFSVRDVLTDMNSSKRRRSSTL